jgi:hypothetical protein
MAKRVRDDIGLNLTHSPNLAFRTADLNPFFTEITDDPFQWMTWRMLLSSRFHRRIWAMSLSGSATGGWRLFVCLCPLPLRCMMPCSRSIQPVLIEGSQDRPRMAPERVPV